MNNFIKNKNTPRDIIIILVFVYIVMYIFQQFLDDRRRISLHCYIRNVTIVFAVYYLCNYKWSWPVFLLPFVVEIIIELLQSNCIFQFDPDENKTINCYNWFEKASRTDPELDYYTEGMYFDDHNISMKEAQFNKFNWMCQAGNIESGTRVLDIGSGRCDFLNYAKTKKGAVATGCTISPDQIDICKERNIDVFVTDITNDPIPQEYRGKFDVIILNGSAEHFRQTCNNKSRDKFWENFFEKIKVLFDPKSNNKRIVITMIHNRRPHTFMENVHWWFLDKGFGGSYPNGKYGLVQHAKNYNVLYIRDATKDYYLYSTNYGKIGQKNMFAVMKNHIPYLPIQLANNPYYLHTFMAAQYSWTRQFAPNGNLPPPMLHQWIVLKLNE
jgi:cyclopropane fatty-acyl-phospholipid synthase-like methyltransferase